MKKFEVILCIVFGASTAILLSLSVVLLVLLKKSRKKTSVTMVGEADEMESPALEDTSDVDVSETVSDENGTVDADPEQQTENEKSEADEDPSNEEKNG